MGLGGFASCHVCHSFKSFHKLLKLCFCRFWTMANTFTGLKLQGEIGKFGTKELSDIEGESLTAYKTLTMSYVTVANICHQLQDAMLDCNGNPLPPN